MMVWKYLMLWHAVRKSRDISCPSEIFITSALLGVGASNTKSIVCCFGMRWKNFSLGKTELCASGMIYFGWKCYTTIQAYLLLLLWKRNFLVLFCFCLSAHWLGIVDLCEEGRDTFWIFCGTSVEWNIDRWFSDIKFVPSLIISIMYFETVQNFFVAEAK